MCFVIALLLGAAAFAVRDDLGMAVMLAMLAFISGSIGADFLPTRQSRKYRKPVIIDAHVGEGSGTFTVDATHNVHVTRELELPPGSSVTIMKDGTYRVEFPTLKKITPVEWDADVFDRCGNRKTVHICHSQDEYDRGQVEDWARSNGYEGQVR